MIPLLWRAQEQEGWVTRPAIEEIARMLDMAEIRVLEVATFYFMFQLQPVGSVAHIQVCGTTSCMICGAEDLIAVCKDKIAESPHQISPCGKFSWEEVECLGACANAPMAQIGKDYYEDLTTESFGALIDRMAAGEVPTPGPQNGRWASEPVSGLTSLTGDAAERANASIYLATELGETVKRIDGTERTASDLALGEDGMARVIKLRGEGKSRIAAVEEAPAPKPAKPEPARTAPPKAAPPKPEPVKAEEAPPPAEDKPALLTEARDGQPDDLKKIKGVGPKLEGLLHSLGVFHFDQVASWTEKEVAWVDYNLEGFKGRIVRDDWVAQAKVLAEGKDA